MWAFSGMNCGNSSGQYFKLDSSLKKKETCLDRISPLARLGELAACGNGDFQGWREPRQSAREQLTGAGGS